MGAEFFEVGKGLEIGAHLRHLIGWNADGAFLATAEAVETGQFIQNARSVRVWHGNLL